MPRRSVFLLVGLGLAAFAVVAEGAPGASPAPAQPSGDAGARAEGGSVSKADVSPPALDDVEHMCALLTSCDGLPIPPSLVPRDFAACVKTMTTEMTSASAVSFSLTLRECGLRANSCGGLRACALRGASVDTCVGRGKASPAGFCDSDGRAISCWHEKVFAVRDCPRGGEQCAVREGEALCTLGPCPADMKESAPACSASGTRILRCEKGKLASLDCGAFGLKCAQASDGPGCATVGKACTAGSRRCEANVAIGCFNGHETRVDCATAGLACAGDPSVGVAIGACVAPAPTEDAGRCDPAAAPRCDGTSITYCGAGARPRSYFCKALGFARCLTDRAGTRCAS
jgi:hypothetical protein